MQPRTAFNRKRRLHPGPLDTEALKALARRVRYGGNPEHKRDPGDFGLTPASQPRSDKTLCDGAGIFRRSVAVRLLRQGIRQGLVSAQVRDGFPQNVWVVTPGGEVLEAQLENRSTGSYHGYPMPVSDPMRAEILRRWGGP